MPSWLRPLLFTILAASFTFYSLPASAQERSDSARKRGSRSEDSGSRESVRSRSGSQGRGRSEAGQSGRTRSSGDRAAAQRPDASKRQVESSGRQRSDSATRQRTDSASRQRTESASRQRSDSASRQRSDSASRQRTESASRQHSDSASRQRTSDRGSGSRRDDDRYRNSRREGDRYRNSRRDDDRYRGNKRIIVNRRPLIHIDIRWPWVFRHQRHWSPRYRYRQIVHINAGWAGRRRDSRIDVRTYYRHRVRNASGSRADVDVFIDRIELYDDGYFIGAVDRIPDNLAYIRAVIDRDGGMGFDRELFLVGDPYVGFEIVSTRHYDGFILNRYSRSDGYRVGALDLRGQRVVEVRRSRLFDPNSFSGLVPISLLPRDDDWLADYGDRAPSRTWYGDDDQYYYGRGEIDDYDRLGDDRTNYSRQAPGAGDNTYSSLPEISPLQRNEDESFTTDDGAEIRLKRESTLERVE